jgi:hypothetical protein
MKVEDVIAMLQTTDEIIFSVKRADGTIDDVRPSYEQAVAALSSAARRYDDDPDGFAPPQITTENGRRVVRFGPLVGGFAV